MNIGEKNKMNNSEENTDVLYKANDINEEVKSKSEISRNL